MSQAREGWYVADSDGLADGPLSREALARYAQRTDLAELTVWHVDWSEWRPLSAMLGLGGAGIAVERERGDRDDGAGSDMRAGLAAAAATGAPVALPAVLAAKQAELKARLKSKFEERVGPRGSAVARETVRAARAELGESLRDGTLTQAELRQVARAARSAAVQRAEQAARAGAERAVAEAKTKTQESAARLGQAVRRLLARLVDTLTVGMLGAVLIGALVIAEMPDLEIAWTLPFLALWLMVPLEALFLAAGGSTPGKALFGLRVVDTRGRALGFGSACARGFLVLMRGLAFGIPVVSLVFAATAAGPLLKDGLTTWDKQLGTRVETKPWSAARWQLGIVVLVCACVLLATGLWIELLDWLQQTIAAMPH